MIWCYDCKVDTPGNGGVFDGPISINLMEMLGIPLHRWNMKKQRIEYIRVCGNKVKWFAREAKRDSHPLPALS
jgi:hypothetical protein